jgi:hypothetical protein
MPLYTIVREDIAATYVSPMLALPPACGVSAS